MLLPTVNPQPLCHRCHLFLGSRRQGPQGTRKCAVGDFSTLAIAMIAEVQSVLSQIAGREGVQEHSDLFAAIGHLDTVWTEVSVRCKGCSSVNSPACRVCQKLGSLCDIPSGKECQSDTAPSEAAPCEDWPIGEVELNTLNDQQHLHRQQTCWNNW